MKSCIHCGRDIPEISTVCTWCHVALPFGVVADEAPAVETSKMAIASLALSFFSVLFAPGVLAVILGHLSRAEIKKSGGRLKGAGLALAGLVVGYVGMALPPVGAIVYPFVARARITANEASAVEFLRTLNTAAKTYASLYKHGFPASPADMGPPAPHAQPGDRGAGLIDKGLASGKKNGYEFDYMPFALDRKGNPHAYTIHADPIKPESTGRRYFFTDQTGIIRAETGKPAMETSPPVNP